MRKVAEASRISAETLAMLCWIVAMPLLLALTGCRMPGASIDPPPLETAGWRTPPSASALASPESPPLPRAASNDVPVGSYRFDAEQPAQVVSLESMPPPDAVGRLTLAAAVNLALERNPDLAAARAAEPVAHAAFHVAETYPWNPQFQTQVLPYSRDRGGNDGAVSQQHVILQTFEMAGQGRIRVEAAAADWQRVQATIGQAELLNVVQTERLFFTALYQRELRDLVRLLADLNDEFVGVIERRMKAGQANNADVVLARLQAQSTRRQQRLAEANFQTALTNLHAQLNLDADASLELSANWLDWQWQPSDTVFACATLDAPLPIDTGVAEHPRRAAEIDEALLRQIVLRRPDVLAAQAAAMTASENLALARAMRRPDLQIGPMWQRDETATEFWGVQAQFNIPVVNTGMPLVQQRVAELQQQQITAARLEDKAVLEARAAIQRYERARRLVEQSRRDFSRGVDEILKPVQDQFDAGQITLLEVFATRTSLAQSQQSFLDLLNELAQAAADVTMTTGLPPQKLLTEKWMKE